LLKADADAKEAAEHAKKLEDEAAAASDAEQKAKLEEEAK